MIRPEALHLVAGREGLWRQIVPNERGAPEDDSAGLFLDRDGVLVEEVNYLHRVADLRLLPGATEIVRLCNAKRIPVVLVTNQSGVGRGYYGWPDFAAVQIELQAVFASDGAHFDMVLACAYHEAAEPPYDVANHPWRKPRAGMLLAAADALRLDLRRSWIVGDSASDIEAGRNAGLAGGLHVMTGHGARDRAQAVSLAGPDYLVRTAADIAGAKELLALLRN